MVLLVREASGVSNPLLYLPVTVQAILWRLKWYEASGVSHTHKTAHDPSPHRLSDVFIHRTNTPLNSDFVSVAFGSVALFVSSAFLVCLRWRSRGGRVAALLLMSFSCVCVSGTQKEAQMNCGRRQLAVGKMFIKRQMRQRIVIVWWQWHPLPHLHHIWSKLDLAHSGRLHLPLSTSGCWCESSFEEDGQGTVGWLDGDRRCFHAPEAI